MSTRSITIKILAIVVLLGFWWSCGRKPRWTDSGLPEAMYSDVLLHAAGAQQGVAVREGNGGRNWCDYSVESSRDFHVSLTSGSLGQLLAAFRGEVRRKIESMGGQIHRTAVSGSESDVREFDYGYTWGSKVGIVRIRSFVDNNGQSAISSFCYEHNR